MKARKLEDFFILVLALFLALSLVAANDPNTLFAGETTSDISLTKS